jgi:hypothetical protein
MEPMMRGFVSFFFALCVLLLGRGAWASDVYDAVLKSELGLPQGPLLCMTCHASLIGGPSTVIKPFGMTARRYGLQQLDVQTLKQVLHQMEANNDDSDCDGVGDIAELRKHSDPNSPDTDAGCADPFEPPRHGFYCTLSRLSAKKGNGPGGTAFASAAGLFAVLLVARRCGAERNRA